MNVSTSGFCSGVLSNSELRQSCQDVGHTLWLYRRRGYDALQRAAPQNTDANAKAEVILLKWRARRQSDHWFNPEFFKKESSYFMFMLHVSKENTLLMERVGNSDIRSLNGRNDTIFTIFKNEILKLCKWQTSDNILWIIPQTSYILFCLSWCLFSFLLSVILFFLYNSSKVTDSLQPYLEAH